MDCNFETKSVKIRKKHRCFGCEKVCEIGTQMEVESGIFWGDFFRCYMCLDCQKFIKENPKYFKDEGDGFSQGFVNEAKYYFGNE